MRLKSSIFVSALIRQVNGEGGFATVLNKGAEEAGAIFIIHAKSRLVSDLYGPAPQSFFEDSNSGERVFELLASEEGTTQIRDRVNAQRRFDPDCWVVELELSGDLPEMLQVAGDRA